MVFNSHNPDVLLLPCLRADPQQAAQTPCVHARTALLAHCDGQDCWLLRTCIRTGLWAIRDRATSPAPVSA